MKKSKKLLPIAICSVLVVLVVVAVVLANVKIVPASNKGSNSNESITVRTDMNVDDYEPAEVTAASEDNGGIGDHTRGNPNAKVVVIEYADLQCPGCASMMSSVHRLYTQYSDKVLFVFRHFPINGHENAPLAAAAAESAGFQGYYWEMIEALYANRTDWVSETDRNKLIDEFVVIFKEVYPNGDESKFRANIYKEEVSKKINFDYNLGKQIDNVTFTPSFFVNGEMIDATAADTIKDYVNLIEVKINEALEE